MSLQELPNLDSEIKKTESLAKGGDPQAAMLLADHLVQSHPREARVWYLRSFLHELSSRFEDAREDITRALDIAPLETHFSYNRGRFNFALDDYAAALRDFTRGLELCDYHKNAYYKDELHFWRAEVFLKLTKGPEALSDLSQLPDDYKTFTYALRTKNDLISDYEKRPR